MTKTNKDPHIYVATPMFGGMCSAQYTASMLRLMPLFMERGWEYSFQFRANESLIDRARNALVMGFLDSNATHLLFVDADIGFEPKDVIALVEADKDVICGIYPMKSINWASVSRAVKMGAPDNELYKYTSNWVLNLLNGDKITAKNNEPFEILHGGTGMMLIKREVFTKLAKNVEHYRGTEIDAAMIKHKDKMIPRYFASSIDQMTGVLLSEDYHFCRLWRWAGGKVWAAPWMRLSHVGTYVFEGLPIQAEKTSEDYPHQ